MSGFDKLGYAVFGGIWDHPRRLALELLGCIIVAATFISIGDGSTAAVIKSLIFATAPFIYFRYKYPQGTVMPPSIFQRGWWQSRHIKVKVWWGGLFVAVFAATSLFMFAIPRYELLGAAIFFLGFPALMIWFFIDRQRITSDD